MAIKPPQQVSRKEKAHHRKDEKRKEKRRHRSHSAEGGKHARAKEKEREHERRKRHREEQDKARREWERQKRREMAREHSRRERDRLEQLERKRERERKMREQQKEQREQKERERRAEERRKEREARREGGGGRALWLGCCSRGELRAARVTPRDEVLRPVAVRHGGRPWGSAVEPGGAFPGPALGRRFCCPHWLGTGLKRWVVAPSFLTNGGESGRSLWVLRDSLQPLSPEL